MILQALTQHYDALLERGELERPGWQPVGVSFGLRLSESGELLDVVDLRVERGEKKKTLVPQMLNLPVQNRITSAPTANFLCHNTEYLLGIGYESPKPSDKDDTIQVKRRHAVSKRDHLEILKEVNSPAAQAVVNFFTRWNPAEGEQNPILLKWGDELAKTNLVFLLGGKYVHEDTAVREAWQRVYDKPKADETIGRCLVTGKKEYIARLHLDIKGVKNASSFGVTLVSFNGSAFESYGKTQGFNAPVGKPAAFAYRAALNALLADREHCIQMGDTTVVFWAEGAQSAYADFFAQMNGTSNEVSDETLRDTMIMLARGDRVQWRDAQLDGANPFYILGLSPNATRVSVRFFLCKRFGEMLTNALRFQDELDIVRSPYDPYETLFISSVLAEIANPKAREKKPPDVLVGAVVRSALEGTPYPAALYQQVQVRLRACEPISRGKAAIIKAYLTRNLTTDTPIKEALTVKLNEETRYTPYVLGRLFAVLEQLQSFAYEKDHKDEKDSKDKKEKKGIDKPKLNATIRDRYFRSACMTPAVAFPSLINLAQAHLKKLDTGAEIYFDKRIQELQCMLDEPYPKRLNLNDQGVFQLGYYHQRQKNFTAKEDKEND